jgi:hypothetical protein
MVLPFANEWRSGTGSPRLYGVTFGLAQLAEAVGQGIIVNRDVAHSKSPESRSKRAMTIADVIPLGGGSASRRGQ